MSLTRTVLFDIDDTLFDHRYSSRVALRDLQDRDPSGLAQLDLDDLERTHLQILNSVHRGVLDGQLTIDEARKRRFGLLYDHYGLTLPAETDAIASRYRDIYQGSWRPTPGAHEVLRLLRSEGLHVGVVSNNVVSEQRMKLDILGLTSLIDTMTISEEAGAAKPDPKIYFVALERAGARAEETVMIGDAWENDVIGARRAGLRTIWFDHYRLGLPTDVPASEHPPRLLDLTDPALVLELVRS